MTVRRLSRTQWENVMRDLFGVRVATTSFPADDLGYGFDSIGDAMTFSTLHLENHLAAARVVAERVFPAPDPGPRRFAACPMRSPSGMGCWWPRKPAMASRSSAGLASVRAV